MIDIGVNLTNSRFDNDRAELIARAQSVGLKHLLITGTNIDESKKALALCQSYPDYLSCTAGVHPHDANNVCTDYIDLIIELSANSAVRAIGECGLDFNRNFSKPEQQIKVFSEQINLALTLSKPLFLHQRDAFEPWLELLTPAIGKVPLVAHCFTGNADQVKACLDADMYFGITGWVCDERRGAELVDAVKHIPLNRIMIETDAPYLTPRNIRPKPKSSRNEPSYLPFVVKALAQAMSVSEDELISHSTQNAREVFQLC